ncbi:response regulator [Robiginitomaculum antarcticum]|uniref:response regulator n=1 Tax=Robiginitomaculum antarcticum TaxID=437507 RepID=UPI000362037E|nr:response regulator [Robiginitomaculum antarcticum]
MTKSILIVEDDPFIAMDLQDTFESAGYVVIGPVAGVASGMSLIERQTPDVAMLDYNLGETTSEPIAKDLFRRNIPFLFLTGQMPKVVENNAFSGAKIISKPFNPDHLVESVESLTQN